MKRIALALSLLATLVCAVPATARMRPGIELGANVSSLTFDDMNTFPLDHWDTSWRASFTGGATLEVPLADRLAIQTGLRYVQQGNRVHYDDGTLRATFRFAQDYVSMPILLAWQPLPSDRFSISLGPEFGVLVAAHTIVEESSPSLTEGRSIKDQLEPTNLTLDAAAGYEFPFHAHTATLGLRYTHGLTGVAKKNQWVSDWKTRGIETLVGMRW